MTTARLIQLYKAETDTAKLAYIVQELNRRLNQVEGHAISRIKAIEYVQGTEDTQLINLAA